MLELLRSSIAQVIVLVAFVLIAATIAWSLLKSYRNREDNDITASNQLVVFREMQQRGRLSEAEFRSIKTILGAKLREELKSSDHQE